MIDPLAAFLQTKWNAGLSWNAFLEFSRKNVEAMREGYASASLDDALVARLKALPGEYRILLLAADWCGDCTANAPVLARLADALPRVELRLFDRDRHPELMDRFLTNGGRAIPKAIAATADFARHATWGPRPGPCQAIMTENKDKMPKDRIYTMIREWYAADGGRTLATEIGAALAELG